MKFSAWYFLSVGVLMIAQWTFFLASDAVPELKTEPLRISFHLAAEFATSSALITAGLGLLAQKPWSKVIGFVAGGMLAYTTIVSPGYFAQQNQWPLVGMFVVLLFLDGVSILRLARNYVLGE